MLSICVKKSANTGAPRLDEDEAKTLVSEENSGEEQPEIKMLMELQGFATSHNNDTSHKLDAGFQVDASGSNNR